MRWFCSELELAPWRTMMTSFKIAGAAAISLLLAGPAMAANVSGSELPTGYHADHVRTVQRMHAQDFDHFDFGIARPTYHSGWGGPYGDGDYPGSVDENMGPPYRGFN
jgi:hypothetical protein